MTGSKRGKRKSEKAIETAILDWLKFVPNCFAWKNNSTGVYDVKAGCFRKNKNKHVINGVADILGVYKGRILALEVKTPENKDRPQEQVDFLEMIRKHGGIAYFVMSVEEARDLIKSAG